MPWKHCTSGEEDWIYGMAQDWSMDRQRAGFKDHYKLRLLVTYYISVRRGLSSLRQVTIAVFHYPRYPWEQKWSHGRYIAMILLRVHPFRAKCCAQCFTMPMLAEELEFRENVFFFPLPHTFSPGWEADLLWTPRERHTRDENIAERYCGMDCRSEARWTKQRWPVTTAY